ncbi:MAG: NAD-dependent epimerase [Betaproteobacteria bacterium]|nr:NAD-dependent epimerase [Betaproteobacteria bacterium]
MKILITGGGGFLGQRVARELLAHGVKTGAGGASVPVSAITLFDIAEPPAGVALKDPRVTFVTGEVSDKAAVAAALGRDTGGVFHFAAVVSGQAEADFDIGMRVNLDGIRNVLEACRAAGNQPRLLFSSSIAVFGVPLPDVVNDGTTPTPQASYGVQKLIGEWLVADFTRKGYIDGRAVRIPTVSVRPGKANAAASSFASAVIREPLNGIDYACPVSEKTLMWMCSPRRVVGNLIRAFELPSETWGPIRSVNLPGITVSVTEMVASLKKLGGEKAAARVSIQVDPRIDAIVQTWAARLETPRADKMGFVADANMDEIVAQYIADEGIKL